MGLSALAAYTLLFMIVIGMVFVLVTTHTMVIKEKSGAVNEMSDIDIRKGNTLINAIFASYNPVNITIWYKNNGNEKLHLDRIDVYLNTTKLDGSDYILDMIEPTNLINSQLWDPSESINLTILKGLSEVNNHIITLSVENGFKRSIGFNVGGGTASLTYADSTKVLSEDVFSFIQYSDSSLATNIAKKNKDDYMYANFTFTSPPTSGYNVIVDHYWDGTAGLNIQDVDLWNGTTWNNLGSLSAFTSEDRDIFPVADDVDYTDIATRLHFNSSSNRENYVNYMTITANVMQWWEIY